MQELLVQNIYRILDDKVSIMLVGATDEGKTWFVINVLIPFLKQQGLRVKYFKDCNDINFQEKIVEDIVIVDEVEVLSDKKYLEEQHPDENPYYTDKYLKEVELWHEKLKQINQPCLYIVTRNELQEQTYFMDHVKSAEWNSKPVKVLLFQRSNNDRLKTITDCALRIKKQRIKI
jgi:hypothetical protein